LLSINVYYTLVSWYCQAKGGNKSPNSILS
jgi:hypothetical protein